MLDLDAIERLAKDEVAYARQVNALLAARGSRPPTFEALVRLPASQMLALVARVRELETEVSEQKAIISTGMSAFIYGRNQGREEGVAAERKRCTKIASDLCEKLFDSSVGYLSEGLIEAIERGDT